MEMDYQNTESKEMLDNIQNAWFAVQNNHQGIEGILNRLFQLLGTILSIIGYVAIIATLQPAILIFLVVNVFLLYFVSEKIKKYEFSERTKVSEIDRKSKYIFSVMSDFTYGKDIRVFNLKKWLSEKFKYFNSEKINIIIKIQNKYFLLNILEIVLTLAREGLIYGYLIYKVITGAIGIGSFTMYFATIDTFTNSLQRIFYILSDIRLQGMYLERYINFIESEDSSDGKREIVTKDNYLIEFENVYFKYPNSSKYIFEDFSLKIEKGQKIALVGLNGSGKTTLVKLLVRLYEPTKGAIKINGVDIKEYKKEEYYKLFSVLFQDIKIIAATISENIALTSKEKCNINKVLQSIDLSGLKEKVSLLDKGIETQMMKYLFNDGVDFSGGEKQKLALARALYKAGDIVILDEPTSSLDPIAEYDIYLNFNNIILNKTAIYISHRLASTRFCDKIALFDNGKIIEIGTHEELLNRGEKYKEMFNIQAKYYVDVKEEACID
ncbi:MAG: ABC transporter ATP-binding protein [Clostridium sartagoforme]|nr:ABC transporter ATP-binding protein [Clostridium sartagoforme]